MSSFCLLFWNIQRKVDPDILASLASTKNVDFICLAESELDSGEMLKALGNNNSNKFLSPNTNTPKIQVFHRDTIKTTVRYGDISGRCAIASIIFDQVEFLIAIMHLISKNNCERVDQYIEATDQAEGIRNYEKKRGNCRTILCGDLNMNPFEDGLVAAKGFHALSDRNLVQKGSRTVHGKEYPFFYNPMWNFFGDMTDGPSGTYYYRKSSHVSHDWHILDQVLLRKDCLPYFSRIEIVTEFNDINLKNDLGRPDKKSYSDHFPILLHLESLK